MPLPKVQLLTFVFASFGFPIKDRTHKEGAGGVRPVGVFGNIYYILCCDARIDNDVTFQAVNRKRNRNHGRYRQSSYSLILPCDGSKSVVARCAQLCLYD